MAVSQCFDDKVKEACAAMDIDDEGVDNFIDQ